MVTILVLKNLNILKIITGIVRPFEFGGVTIRLIQAGIINWKPDFVQSTRLNGVFLFPESQFKIGLISEDDLPTR